MVSVVIAFRRDRLSKTRLSDLFTQDERMAIADAMFENLVNLVRMAIPSASLFVLAPENPKVRGSVWIRDSGVDLNNAVNGASGSLPQCPTIFLPADLPLISLDALRKLRTLALTHEVVISPDRHDEGTNALTLARPGLISTCFGKMSFEAHKRACIDAGIAPVVFRSSDIELDLDTPADFSLYQQRKEMRQYA